MARFQPPWEGPPFRGRDPYPFIDFTEPELSTLGKEYESRWISLYPPRLVDMATRFAKSWTEGTLAKNPLWKPLQTLAPPGVVTTIVKEVYRKGLDVADGWIKSMGGGS